jgi:hypothetical protein
MLLLPIIAILTSPRARFAGFVRSIGISFRDTKHFILLNPQANGSYDTIEVR